MKIMQQNYLNELKSACNKVESFSDQEKLEVGETIWIAGSAARSTEGTIALQIGNDQTVVIKEKHILEVNKDGDIYFVKIRVGTDLLYRIEIVSQVRPNCKCKQDEGGGSHLSSNVERRAIVIVKGCTVCTMDYNCMTFVDTQGYVRVVCIPIIRCENRCI